MALNTSEPRTVLNICCAIWKVMLQWRSSFCCKEAHFYEWSKSTKSLKFKLIQGKTQIGILICITLQHLLLGNLNFPPTFVTYSEPCIHIYTDTVTERCIRTYNPSNVFTGNIQFYTILKPTVGNSTVCLNKLVLQHKQLANKQSDLPIFWSPSFWHRTGHKLLSVVNEWKTVQS